MKDLSALESSLTKLGYNGSLIAAFEASLNEIETSIRAKCARLAPDLVGQDRAEATWAIEKKVRESFRWQRFLSRGILKKHATEFVQAVAKSTLPFVQYECARVADRKDSFARRIFLTSLCDNRTRMQLQEFRLSRAYFFGTLIREGRNTDGSLRMYPCMLKNSCGRICNNFCDPFGHHCFVCKITTKTADHNMCRDILSTMGNAFGFVTSKEVVVAPWFKKPDVEFLDASGELLTIYLDVTLPALHQEAITSREEIYENARQLKAKSYPRKDSAGRLLNESFCLPFILTSMGGLCEEGHDFLRLCKNAIKEPPCICWTFLSHSMRSGLQSE